MVQFRESILKSIEKKLNSSDLNDYDLLMAAMIYYNEQVHILCQILQTDLIDCFVLLTFLQLNISMLVRHAVHYAFPMVLTGTRRICPTIKLLELAITIFPLLLKL